MDYLPTLVPPAMQWYCYRYITHVAASASREITASNTVFACNPSATNSHYTATVSTRNAPTVSHVVIPPRTLHRMYLRPVTVGGTKT